MACPKGKFEKWFSLHPENIICINVWFWRAALHNWQYIKIYINFSDIHTSFQKWQSFKWQKDLNSNLVEICQVHECLATRSLLSFLLLTVRWHLYITCRHTQSTNTKIWHYHSPFIGKIHFCKWTVSCGDFCWWCRWIIACSRLNNNKDRNQRVNLCYA